MIGIALFSARIAFVAVWVLLGLASVMLVFPLASSRLRAAMTLWWSRILMVFCGVRMRVVGEPYRKGPVLWAANHVSWVDIFVLNSVRPTAFIAKSDIRKWPLLGWLVAGAGTVFIERGRRHAVRAVGREMKLRFERGEVIGLFPEGTTSSGYDVAPFHSSLFDAAIRAGVDIQPVALRFFHRGQRSDVVAFVGEQTLMQNLWCLLSRTGTEVEVCFLPIMAADHCDAEGRAHIAARAHDAIRARVVEQAMAGQS
ncbi:MAG: 1-acyl-sn-glycerol-3-phosphate acyltransferase [Candidimonas sp.]|nr:1-acyl-sn-glycerol-3-phosphate acyltransferase [Candidimonas sp.]